MTTTPKSQLKGIGGWLLFFCIILTILTPVVILGVIGATSTLSDSIQDRFPAYVRLITIGQIINFGFFFYCLYVGIALWQTKKGAVSKVQMFLIAYACFALLRAVMPYLGDLSGDIKTRLVNIYGLNAIRVFFFSLIWHQYLARSVRVKNTFPES